jgi:hypothetical protein
MTEQEAAVDATGDGEQHEVECAHKEMGDAEDHSTGAEGARCCEGRVRPSLTRDDQPDQARDRSGAGDSMPQFAIALSHEKPAPGRWRPESPTTSGRRREIARLLD